MRKQSSSKISGLWPTPTANDDNKSVEAHLAMKKRMGVRDGTGANRTAITSLQVMAKADAEGYFPTSEPSLDCPTEEQLYLPAGFRWNSTECFLTWKVKATPCNRLLFQLAPLMPSTEETEFGLWATPRAEEREQYNSQDDYVALSKQVKMWPTPQAHDVTTRGNTEADHHHYPHDLSNAAEANSRLGGSLNPTWVEWLMGYPTGWTALKDSAMRSSRKSRMKS